MQLSKEIPAAFMAVEVPRFHLQNEDLQWQPPLEGEILAKHLEKQNRKLYCPTVKKLFDEPCSLSSHKP